MKWLDEKTLFFLFVARYKLKIQKEVSLVAFFF